MSEIPNIFKLIAEDRRQEAVELLTRGFRIAAAAGSRSTTAAMAAATRLFDGDLKATAIWMNEHHPHLQASPLEAAERSEEGLQQVLDLIGRAEHGVYG